MSIEDVIKQCRDYKGQNRCPANTPSTFWNYERIWAEWTIEAEDENSLGAKELKAMLKRYKEVNLENFQIDDGTPITLKAFLFNRFEHWTDGVGFEDWYQKNYKRYRL